MHARHVPTRPTSHSKTAVFLSRMYANPHLVLYPAAGCHCRPK
jgi:hypothetical protein